MSVAHVPCVKLDRASWDRMVSATIGTEGEGKSMAEGSSSDRDQGWRSPVDALMLMSVANSLSFATWNALHTNFAIDAIHFDGTANAAVLVIGAATAGVALGLSLLVPHDPSAGNETMFATGRPRAAGAE